MFDEYYCSYGCLLKNVPASIADPFRSQLRDITIERINFFHNLFEHPPLTTEEMDGLGLS